MIKSGDGGDDDDCHNNCQTVSVYKQIRADNWYTLQWSFTLV